MPIKYTDLTVVKSVFKPITDVYEFIVFMLTYKWWFSLHFKPPNGNWSRWTELIDIESKGRSKFYKEWFFYSHEIENQIIFYGYKIASNPIQSIWYLNCNYMV